MNIISNILAEIFPGPAIIRKADDLLSNKPEGFHPIAKKMYRRECLDVLNSFNKLIERRQGGRIIGNKGVSNATKLRVEKLKSIAR